MAFPTGWTLLEQIDIDITSLSLSGALTNYPINIVTLTSETFAKLESDGKDLRFTSDEAGTTELPLEIVSIDTGAETIQCWVKISSLSATTTTIYAWGNNSSATAYARDDTYGSDNVWRSEYKGVWHLDETSGTRADSTANANNLTDNNTVTSGTGKIGTGADFERDNSEYLSIADGSQTGLDLGSSDVTFQSWINLESLPSTPSDEYEIMSKGDWGGVNRRSYSFKLSTNDELYIQYTSNGQTTSRTTIIADNAFDSGDLGNLMAVAMSIDVSAHTGSIYVDGSSVAKTDSETSGTSFYNDPDPFSIGARTANGSGDNFFDGIIDEARIYAGILSADWIKTDYNLQNAPATYITNTAIGGSVKSLFYQQI